VKFELVTAPAEEPVSLAEAKVQLRVDHSEEDAFILSKISAARRFCEDASQRAFVTQTLRMWADEFPAASAPQLYLPRPKVQSVTSIKYVDEAGTLQTLDSSLYDVDAISEPAYVVPAFGKSWPVARAKVNAIQVEFVAGWGAASAVDERAKQAIMMLVAHWYQHREAAADVSIKEVEMAACSLLGQLWHGRMI
jgi:uncharacterized phiE125 gp8 family phage protein